MQTSLSKNGVLKNMAITGHPWTGKYDNRCMNLTHTLAEVRTGSYFLLLSLMIMPSSENEKL
jgi:hypothetical protein